MTTTPGSTYRVQMRAGFTFDDLSVVADYLAALGVSAVYTSPLLQAAPGSTHGYDVVDPGRASDELGGEEGRQRLVRRLRELGLGLVVDIVPNHLDVSDPVANRWWWDVLEHGRASEFAHFFDIDWDAGPLLLPMLPDEGDPLTELKIDEDELLWRDLRFPTADGTLGGSPNDVHARQHYRLVSWRLASYSLTYRRFFDVSNLAGVRVEDPEVFDATHAEVLRWVRAGEVDTSRARIAQLDEYVGLPAEHPESYRSVLRREVLEPLGIGMDAFMGPDGTAEDVQAACEAYDAALAHRAVVARLLGRVPRRAGPVRRGPARAPRPRRRRGARRRARAHRAAREHAPGRDRRRHLPRRPHALRRAICRGVLHARRPQRPVGPGAAQRGPRRPQPARGRPGVDARGRRYLSEHDPSVRVHSGWNTHGSRDGSS